MTNDEQPLQAASELTDDRVKGVEHIYFLGDNVPVFRFEGNY